MLFFLIFILLCINLIQSKVMSKQHFNILIVEDDKVTSQYFRKVLEKENYTIDVASDGLQALEALKRRSFDFVSYGLVNAKT